MWLRLKRLTGRVGEKMALKLVGKIPEYYPFRIGTKFAVLWSLVYRLVLCCSVVPLLSATPTPPSVSGRDIKVVLIAGDSLKDRTRCLSEKVFNGMRNKQCVDDHCQLRQSIPPLRNQVLIISRRRITFFEPPDSTSYLPTSACLHQML